ncbi:angiotensin-converting enzyme-like isoform X2 [Venturia canescens]|uniref:angiotensin-converting enzyme-like isoform X2 n=1 Tax=Venturia canescens TaxID=32260 RepID=UPI001C9CB186|nr:angiotensin-converting enzyme-like isoform X2 [Venturia canescens]
MNFTVAYLIIAAIVEASNFTDCFELENLLEKMNNELLLMNRVSVHLEWESSTQPSREIFSLKRQFSMAKNQWKNQICSKLNSYRDDSLPAARMIRLLCRGPAYSADQILAFTNVSHELMTRYASLQVCRTEMGHWKCYHGEPDLKIFMSKSRNESELRWAWTSWRNEMSGVKKLFEFSINLQNSAARNNGYSDIGACWREELEISNLEDFIENLYGKVEHLYRLLHAVVRFRLHQLYPEAVHPHRPIPAHLLGDLWSQNWSSLIDLILSKEENFLHITESLLRKNYTVKAMVEHAEDYYVSLGFPQLSREFWSRSIFTENNSTEANCHATAVNMFEQNDYRVIACLGINAYDFNVIHHEIGHIQYYMAYEKQPTIFQNGVNSAFHEAIGDSVMLGVMTPQHLQRLGLAEDAILTNDLGLLLSQALAKLPELPYALLMDKWRWKVFAAEENSSSYNSLWWKMHKRYMGIEPPSPRDDSFFDPSAKFHIISNTPYVRYFLGNILQYQLFDGMCEAGLTGRIGDPKFSMELHRCDIYGSKKATKRLRSLMSRGSSIGWREWILATSGSPEITARSLLRYYEPIKKWLENEIRRHRIPVGWE